MTPPAHFVLISRTNFLDFSDLQKIAASVDAQLKDDYYPIWRRKADIIAYQHESDAPLGSWKVYIQERLDAPGALGYHTDEHNQPVAYVQYDQDLNALCVTVSHECLETVSDPFGNRLIVAIHPSANHKVRILCEVCDPSESKSYTKLGLQVSDFYTPEWFDDAKIVGMKYSFMDVIPGPRQLLNGGYMSFIDTDNKWRQVTWFNGSKPILTPPLNWELKDGQSLREMVDEFTQEARAHIGTEE